MAEPPSNRTSIRLLGPNLIPCSSYPAKAKKAVPAACARAKNAANLIMSLALRQAEDEFPSRYHLLSIGTKPPRSLLRFCLTMARP